MKNIWNKLVFDTGKSTKDVSSLKKIEIGKDLNSILDTALLDGDEAYFDTVVNALEDAHEKRINAKFSQTVKNQLSLIKSKTLKSNITTPVKQLRQVMVYLRK